MKDNNKYNITITTTTGITDDYYNVIFDTDKNGFVIISLSNGKEVLYPVTNITRIIKSNSQ